MEWVIPCNPKYYRIQESFSIYESLVWRQTSNINVNDIVYIYVSNPVSAICYKCEATKVNIADPPQIDDNLSNEDYLIQIEDKFMELKLLQSYDPTLIPYRELIDHGLNSVQGPSRVTSELSEFIHEKENQSEKALTLEKYVEPSKEKYIEEKLELFIISKTEERVFSDELEILRKKFVDDFSVMNISTLTKEEYVVGLEKDDTFCYRLEKELQNLGDIHGSTAIKFGLYYGIRGDDTDKKYRTSENKFGKNIDEAFNLIKDEIVRLLVAGSNNDIQSIRESLLSPMFRGKILSTYYPEKFLNIFSNNHLEHFVDCLGIEVVTKADEITNQQQLLNWKRSNALADSLSINEFSDFLYETFGRPTSIRKFAKQRRDKIYDCTSSLYNVSKNKWTDLLRNRKIFREEDFSLLSFIYLGTGYSRKLAELIRNGQNEKNAILNQIEELSLRVLEYLKSCSRFSCDSRQSWQYLFSGNYCSTGEYELKLLPNLVDALEEISPNLILIKDDQFGEYDLIDQLSNWIPDIYDLDNLEVSLQKRSQPILSGNHLFYPRNRSIATNALSRANFKCEIDPKHKLFVRKNSDSTYTEPHHIIPMAYSQEFEYSLDIEENIASLCSHCHNQIHYGECSRALIEELFHKRSVKLNSVGLRITLEKLLSMYNL